MAAVHSRRNRAHRVIVLDGATKPGAKILVSGGSRCNVTNTVVTEQDFWGGRSTIVRRILRAYPAGDVVTFFDTLGVRLHEEEDGKLFPDSNRSRDVLDALLRAVADSGAELFGATRVTAVHRHGGGFVLTTPQGPLAASAVVLATGGLSLPKTGSDGSGYALAKALGHSMIAPLPALAPLTLEETDRYAVHRELSGVSQKVEIAIWVAGALSRRLTGSLLWTHFGVSGPVVLNASRHWGRATLESDDVRVTLNFHPGRSFEDVEQAWIGRIRDRPTGSVRSEVAADIPLAVADALLRALSLEPGALLANLSREDRRRLIHGLVEWPLRVRETRGYNYAEVTAGGVDLAEIDPATMESRRCAGLYLVGEILDVDGRIGGFNFQWAWATGKVAGSALSDGSTRTRGVR